MATDWIAALGEGSTLLTGSDRLARHLQQRYADHQLAAGLAAWERPRILSFSAFTRYLYERLRERSPAAPELLPRPAERLLWESITADSEAGRAVLQPVALAAAAADSWRRLQAYPVPAERLAAVEKEDCREFLSLAARFDAGLQRDGRVAQAQLPSLLAGQVAMLAAELPAGLLVAGLDEAAPDQQRLLEAIEAAGVAVKRLPAPQREARAGRLACADSQAEARAVAAWAARQLAERPDCRVGVVVPDLEARRDDIRAALREALQPALLPSFRTDPATFNISLGDSLVEQPLPRAALDALALADTTASLDQAGRLLRSPYLFPDAPAGPRARLEYRLRNTGHPEFSARYLLKLADAEGLEGMAAALRRYLDRVAAESSRALPSEWARRLAGQLACLGWGRRSDGESLDSNEYQAREALHSLLGELGGCDLLGERWPRSRAVKELRRLAQEQLFQPRAAQAPVQVLGWLEATGLDFDALWIMGLEDTVLPPAPRPDPLLPVGLQREFDWPHSSAEREYEFAQRQLQRLLQAGDEVVCSYPQMDGDRPLRASPLLAGLPEREVVPLQAAVAQHQRDAAAPPEVLEDLRGPRLDDPRVKGGTRFVEDQSACAFRAFASHRLRAHDWPTPQPGPDPRLRGKLVHDVLEDLWDQWRQRSALAALDATTRRAAVDAAVERQLQQSRQKLPAAWPPGLLQLEQRRLVQLVEDWLELELERDDFAVVARELEIDVAAGPLLMRGRIDRIDRLPGGGELLIDYKTGGSVSASGWDGERPASPQLPLYAINRPEQPAGIAFARVRAGEMRMSGLAGGDAGTAGISDVDAKAEDKDGLPDWDARMQGWRSVLARLGEEAVAGEARPDPLPGACDYCHLRTLCRIDELRGEISRLESAEVTDGD